MSSECWFVERISKWNMLFRLLEGSRSLEESWGKQKGVQFGNEGLSTKESLGG